MNRFLLLTRVHLHPDRATFSHHETQYVRRVFMQIIPQNLKTPQKNLQTPPKTGRTHEQADNTVTVQYHQSLEFGQNHRLLLLSCLVLSIRFLPKNKS